MLESHSCNRADFTTKWYKRWAKELLQDDAHREEYDLHANKFWQNAVMTQLLHERGMLKKGKKAVGFGVGRERLPALFAKYGVQVMATDQDFQTTKADHWAARELATSAYSLNKLGICPRKQFAELVDYMPVDMTQVPEELHEQYDFLWSNCALGHLSSIPEGLRFIEESLRCLKPGGWAVHTTEVNVLSNRDTVVDGDTVIFRLKDLHELQARLLQKGYIMQPLRLTLGEMPEDKRISLSPQFGNDYSKIQFRDHLLTQVVLVVHKPTEPLSLRAKIAQQIVEYRAYSANLAAMSRYKRTDPIMRHFRSSKSVAAHALSIRPHNQKLRVTIPKGGSKTVRLHFTNESPAMLFGAATGLHANPVVLATNGPLNRDSPFHHPSWLSKNRPSATVEQKTGKQHQRVEYVAPGEDLSFNLTLNAKKLAPGNYRERFCLVQELVDWLPGTEVEVNVQVA